MVLNLLKTTVKGNMIHFVFQGVHKIKINFHRGCQRQRENCVM